jgi:membrane protein YqaA with SNARE-associated domain
MAGMTLLWQSGKTAAHRAVLGSAKSGHLLRWLISLGGIGLFGVAIIDSSVIPLPLPGSTDLLLLLLSSHRGSTMVTALTLAGSAFAGSMVGGYLTWGAGRKGGKAALERYVPQRMLGRVTGWVERRGAWSVGVAAILPPPVPLTPFLLAAGALGVPLVPYLSFYGAARLIRYGLLAWLGVTYGRYVVRLWQKDLSNWSSTILWVYGGLLLVGIAFGIWKFRKSRAAASATNAPVEKSV